MVQWHKKKKKMQKDRLMLTQRPLPPGNDLLTLMQCSQRSDAPRFLEYGNIKEYNLNLANLYTYSWKACT